MTNDETKQADESTQAKAPEAAAAEAPVTEAPATEESAAPEATAAEEVAAEVAPPKVEDPAEVRAAAKEALEALRENPTAAEALPNLATISELVKDPSLETDLVAAAQAVVLGTLAAPQLPPGTHAHMTVLFSHLLALPNERDAVDALYAAWVRHADAFGVGHATPAAFQQEVFVQRLGDLLGWGLLDGDADHDGLARFAAWIDSWNPRNKFRVRRVIDLLHRNFPARGAWRGVHFPSGEGRGSRPQGQHQGPPRGPKPDAPAEAAQAAPEAAEAAPEGEAQPASADGAQAPREGKRRRRRGGRKNRGRKEGAAGGAAPGEVDENAGNLKPAEPSHDDDDDDTQPPGI
ncbi:MAG: hypothetical protein R3A48_11535 [Polyangiales bacterium]